MSQLTFHNFEVSRKFFLSHLESLDASLADVQPEGFNNNIRWHVGHVLTSTENLMFDYPKESSNLPSDYLNLFNRGTSPADWKGEVPTIEELKQHLTDQLARVKEIPEERLQEKLKQSFFDFTKFGELFNFAVFHETYHLGQIHAIKRVIENQAIKQS
jgi:uncharacterized damage-inducible protein DinB